MDMGDRKTGCILNLLYLHRVMPHYLGALAIA